jgi:hypothetical protein
MSLYAVIAAALMTFAVAPAHGQWNYRSNQDALRGITNHNAILFAEDRGGALVVRNRNNSVEIFVTVSRGGILDYDTRTDRVRINYRIDGGPIETTTGSSSSDRTGVFLPNPTQFVTRLIGASRMIIEVPMFRRSDVQLIFDLTGFSPDKVGLQGAAPPPKPAPEKTE